MSNTRALLPTGRQALTHAGEVAYWGVMLLAWLWLGEQGMRLGWSLASGVLAVSLWWAVRILCRGRLWALPRRPLWMGVCGGLTALGVWLPGAMHDGANAHAALLAVAVVWGVWSALIETRSQTSTFRLGRLAWHPLLAAAVVALVWRLSEHSLAAPFWPSCLLLACAAVLQGRERQSTGHAARCKAKAALCPQLLAPSAMGWMMGTLWLGDAWCVGLGWTPEQMVWMHLGLMAALPALVALCLRLLPHGAAVSAYHAPVGAVLMVLGAMMLLGSTAVHGLLAMWLPSLAWALHCTRHGMTRLVPQPSVGPWPAWAVRWVALVLGPGILLAVGMASPSLGPVAMQAALAALGGLAAGWLLLSAWQPRVMGHSSLATSLS